jgi:hypothetical protein
MLLFSHSHSISWSVFAARSAPICIPTQSLSLIDLLHENAAQIKYWVISNKKWQTLKPHDFSHKIITSCRQVRVRSCTQHARTQLFDTNVAKYYRIQQMYRSVQILYIAFVYTTHNRSVAIMRKPAPIPGRLQPRELHTDSSYVCLQFSIVILFQGNENL